MNKKKTEETTDNSEYGIVFQTLQKFDKNSSGETYIFIVGIDNYEEEDDRDYCLRNSKDLMKIFSKNYKVPRKNTYLLLNEHATKRNIMSHLANFDEILDEKDQLLIYFAGIGFHSEYANFFMPVDGEKDNYNSNIPNELLAKIIHGYSSDSVLMHFDLTFPDTKQRYLDPYIKSEHYSKTLHRECLNLFEKPEQNLHLDFVNFLCKNERGRLKDTFYFQKTTNVDLHWGKRDFFRTKLVIFAANHFASILSLITQDLIADALTEMRNIVSNNDDDLLGRVDSLSFMVDQLTDETSSVQPSIEPVTKEEISELSIEVLNKIDQNGFYLVKTPKEIAAQQVKDPIKILFAAANPRDADHLRLRHELKAIEFELMRSKLRDQFKLIKIQTADVKEIQDSLLNEAPHYIHFCGHGNCDGIALLNDLDKVKIVKNKPLAELFSLFSADVKCVFLNSCHSIEQSKEISQYIDHVVCMNNSVPDDTAILFASSFYQSIGSGKDIKFSFGFAKNSVALNDLSGDDIPVLIMN